MCSFAISPVPPAHQPDESRRCERSELPPGDQRDGRWVAFVSNATDFVADDNNDASDVFLHDLHTSKTSLVSRSASGGTANGASSRPAISANGQYVAFESDASNLVCSKRCSP